MLTFFKNSVKNFLKKHLLYYKVRHQFGAAAQAAQVQLWHYYRDKAASGQFPDLKTTGLKAFSQFEEDGILLAIFAAIGNGTKRFVDIGAHDGVNSNCANWALNFGWHGVFIDGDAAALARGRHFYGRYPDPFSFPPVFVQAHITPQNINALIQNAGFEGDIDLVSLDLDGSDYWIWQALTVVRPRVVVFETHVEFGLHNIVVPYKAVGKNRHPLYHGASPMAVSLLAAQKGYRLVAANDLGHNHIYLRNDLLNDLIPTISVAQTLKHPSLAQGFADCKAIADWEYETPIPE
jgi:hypothetical protein